MLTALLVLVGTFVPAGVATAAAGAAAPPLRGTELSTRRPSLPAASGGSAERPTGTTPVRVMAAELTTPTCSEPVAGLRPSAPRRRRSGSSATASSATVSVLASASGADAYSAAVLADGARAYWRLGESSGTTAADAVGSDHLTVGSAVTRGAAGAVAGDTASTFDGTTNGTGWTGTAIAGPDTFTAEAWVRTTSTSGGTVIGFGDRQTGNSGDKDRLVYLTGNGQLVFGVYPGRVETVASGAGYNDGAWHHVVATMGPAGMALYVDGRRAGSNPSSTGQGYAGYWRVGGDSLTGWPQRPASDYLSGSIDEVALYPTALSPEQVQRHFTATGRTIAKAEQPTDAYGAAVFSAGPDSYWRLAETAGPAAKDSSPNSAGPGWTGSYSGGVGFGTAGAVARGGTAVTLDGSTGAIVASQSVQNPTVYSTELWFNTTTLRGGKLIGFGNQQAGGSSNYDRHVYMLNDGRLRFGTWTGQLNLADTTKSYNDGGWHHMVATQGADGMKLYVDGALAASNPQTAAEDFTGFWRVGGDNLAHWSDRPASDYLSGSIDEVAVYSHALSAAVVADHYAQRSVAPPPPRNAAPVASFTAATSPLTVSVDGSGSGDSDGTVASYAWDFGDGSTATGATAQRTYATAGTYSVTLTVTDDAGAIGAAITQVSVAALRPRVGGALAVETFDRTVAGGWGTSDSGDPYLLSGGNANFSVSDGLGRMRLTGAGATTSAYLSGVSSSATDVRAGVAVDGRQTGGGTHLWLVGRRVGADEYRLKVCVPATGPVSYWLVRIVGGVETQLSPVGTLAGGQVRGERLNARLQVSGTGSTMLAAKLWRAGAREPARWGVKVTDTTASLQAPGSVGLVSQLSRSSTSSPVVVSWSGPSFATTACRPATGPRRLLGRCRGSATG